MGPMPPFNHHLHRGVGGWDGVESLLWTFVRVAAAAGRSNSHAIQQRNRGNKTLVSRLDGDTERHSQTR